jgi:hypothetical protein
MPNALASCTFAAALLRGKHCIGKIINKAGRLSGFRQKPSHVVDNEIASQTWSILSGLDLKHIEVHVQYCAYQLILIISISPC